MAINNKFIHFKNWDYFNTRKLSANETNTQYTVGVSGSVQEGSPEVLFQSMCWIKDVKKMWTHGTLYSYYDDNIAYLTTSDIKTLGGQSLIGSGDLPIPDHTHTLSQIKDLPEGTYVDSGIIYVPNGALLVGGNTLLFNDGIITKGIISDGYSFDLDHKLELDKDTKRLRLKYDLTGEGLTEEYPLMSDIDAKVQKLLTDTELKFFCIEPVTVVVGEDSKTYDANTLVDIFLKNSDNFEVIPTSNKSISTLYAWPSALGTYYEWLEGVNLFDGVLFNMNNENLYTKWSQGNQGLYHVQFAQYKNCIFWSDLPYISDVSKRTNYTMYYSSELPLCYSTIPDNTFKAFYFAYNVTCDPNWSNPAYKESFAKATWATQVFSYYGLHSIGIFDWDSPNFNITLPKDCRGLMYYAPNVLNAGVFDAINTTNFGAKSGSWRDAFACCYTLTNLYIKNLKVNLNISWSPINQQSLNFILSKAANTNAITIWLSPHTYYGLTDANKTLAAEKNITLSLIDTNTTEDNRLHMLQMTGDGNSYLANDGTYKSIEIPEGMAEIVGSLYSSNFNQDFNSDFEL